MLLLVVGTRLPGARAVAGAGALGTAALVAAGLAAGSSLVPLLLAVHFLVGPALLGPRSARVLLPVQFLLVPAAVFLFAATGVLLQSLLGSETAAGLVAAAFFALEPALVGAWLATDRERA